MIGYVIAGFVIGYFYFALCARVMMNQHSMDELRRTGKVR